MNTYDVVIIGGGPGGYVAAIRGAQLGLNVCLVEQDRLGGTCLNWGCIPTKAMAASARVLETVRKAGQFGVELDPDATGVRPNFQAIMKRKQDIVDKLVGGIELIFKKRNITVLKGRAKFSSKSTCIVNGEEISARYFIIATGTVSASLPNLGFDGESVLTSKDMLSAESVPQRLLIVGGGYIGCEFASIFSTLGSAVTIIDIAPRILTNIDNDIIKILSLKFRKSGIKFLAETGVDGIEKSPDGSALRVVLSGGRSIEADKILVSVGRRPDTGELGLATTGVAADSKGYIAVGGDMATNIENIYAVGDITGRVQLAHVASSQGLTAIENIAGKLGKTAAADVGDAAIRSMDYRAVPSCIFTNPEIAVAGLTEDQAKDMGIGVKVGRFPFAANGKALTEGEADGFVKIVSDAADGAVIGVHMIGAGVSSLIAEGALAVQCRLKAADLAATIHAHPTLPEATMEAAEAVLGKAIHILQ